MAAKFVILAVLVAAACGSPAGDYTSYSYGVTDHSTGDVKDHEETRAGATAVGQYSLLELNGSKRNVKYAFNANPAVAALAADPEYRGPLANGAHGAHGGYGAGYPGYANSLAYNGAAGYGNPLAYGAGAHGYANPLAHGYANPLAHGYANPLAHGYANPLAHGYAPNAYGLANPLAYGGYGAHGAYGGYGSPLAHGAAGPLGYGHGAGYGSRLGW